MEQPALCIGVTLFFLMFFAFLIVWRYINFRETIALAEKGIYKPERSADARANAKGYSTALRWGIICVALGLALSLGLWPLSSVFSQTNQFFLGMGPWMLFGFIPLFFGLALILISILTTNGNHKVEKPEEPKKEAGEDAENISSLPPAE